MRNRERTRSEHLGSKSSSLQRPTDFPTLLTFSTLGSAFNVLFRGPSRNKRYTFETSRQALTCTDTTKLTSCCSFVFVCNSMLLIAECLKWDMHVRCEHQCVSDLGLHLVFLLLPQLMFNV